MKISKDWREFLQKFNELYGQKSFQFEEKKEDVSEFNAKLKTALEYDPNEDGEN